MSIAHYELKVACESADPEASLNTLAHIKEPLEALMSSAVLFAEREIGYDDLLAAIQDFRLHVQVGLQMRCPVCQAAMKALVPPDCPRCKGHGWVWQEEAAK